MRARSRTRRGLGLIELMISLSICAGLLVAIGVAYVASAAAVETNDKFFRAANGARIAMTQLQAAIRRCDYCQVASSTRIDLITYDAKDVSYIYDATTRELRLVNNSSSGSNYVLARNVTGVSFVADSEYYPRTTTSRVVRVTISLDVKVGNEQVHLSGSAVPRRAVVY